MPKKTAKNPVAPLSTVGEAYTAAPAPLPLIVASAVREPALSFWDTSSIYALKCPPHRASVDVWHRTEPGFGVRISCPRKRDGTVSRSYLARYKDAEGVEKRPVLGTFDDLALRDALAQAQTLRNEMAERRRSGRPIEPTLKAAVETYAGRESLAPASREDYLKRLRYLTGWPQTPKMQAKLRPADYLASWAERKLGSITPAEWLERYEKIERISGTGTAKGLARMMHAVYGDLVTTQALKENPTSILRRFEIYGRSGKARRFVARRELPLLWQWMHTNAHPAVRDYILVGLMTGLRESVLGALAWDRVDMRTRTLLVPRTQRGNKRRVDIALPLADELYRRVFEPRYAARKPGEDWVLPSPKIKGKPLRDIKGSFAALRAATGLHISDHDLRRTMSALARVVTRDALLASRMLTHSDSSMTEGGPVHTGGYLPIEGDEMRDAFNMTANALVWFATNLPDARPPHRLPEEWLERACGHPRL